MESQVSVPVTTATPYLAPTGQMAFTWYFAHIVVGLGGIGLLGLTTSQPLWLAVGTALLFFAFAIVASVAWKKRFKQGPLEWLMRLVAG